MPYTYTKLATPTTIRLIQVMPEKVNNAIACIIHTHETEKLQETHQEIRYRALSYRWGDPQANRHVFLKDADETEWHQYAVHENLWEFIAYAWHENLFEDRFWTDYFCLDQNSDEEIAQQIPRMGVIYAQATETVIWLGLSESEETHIQRFIGKWGKYYIEYSPRLDNDTDRTTVETVKALWRNEYWARVWIIQEVVLAKRATVLMRSFSIDLEDLYWGTYGASFNPTRPSIRQLIKLREKPERRSWRNLLRDNISMLYHCTKPNDRMYGLLGLVQTPTDFVRIDYDRPYGHVILDAVFEAGAGCSGAWAMEVLDAMKNDNAFMLTKNANELEEYLHDRRTLPQHKELANLALQAFDAISFIIANSSQREWPRKFCHLSSNKGEYLEQEAIILGLSLGIGGKQVWAIQLLEDWKTNRQPRLQARSWKSPWQCKVHYEESQVRIHHQRLQDIEEHLKSYRRGHQGRSSLPDYMQQYNEEYVRRFREYPSSAVYMKRYKREYTRYFQEELSTEKYMGESSRWFHQKPRLDFKRIKEGREPALVCEGHLKSRDSPFASDIINGCAQANEHCDVSEMSFAMPHHGFRMIIINGDHARVELFTKKGWTSSAEP